MPTRATTWRGYRWRMTLVAVMCLGFAAWCMFDGLIKYPNQNKVYHAYHDPPKSYLDQWWPPIARIRQWPMDPREMIKVYHQLPRNISTTQRSTQWRDVSSPNDWPQNLDEAGQLVQTFQETRDDMWSDYAKKNGWPGEVEKVPHLRSDFDVATQFIMFAITFVIGSVYTLTVLRSMNRWIEVDAHGLNTSWGQHVPFDAIVRLNKRRWEKGIAVVWYQDVGGERKLVLDDWKFERELTDQIINEVEGHLKVDQIELPAGKSSPT